MRYFVRVKAMYKCWFYLTEVMKDAELDWSKYVVLPFVPNSGMTIQFGDDESDFTPHHVIYDVGDDAFWCYGIDDGSLNCPCTEEDPCCIESENGRAWYLDAGWTLDCVRTGEDRHHLDRPGIFGSTISDKQ